MSQVDYDEGCEDGRKSRDGDIARLELLLEFARTDLARERAETLRYREMSRPAFATADVPF